MRIRREHPKDYNAILGLTYEAFLTLDYPGRKRLDEHFLVSLLRGSEFIIPELCFVVEWGGEIAGHILYTKSEILRADGTKTRTITFGPLSVLPAYHRQGIGAALVGHSLEKARELGYGAVLITGVPDYYLKLGFKRARQYGLTLPDGTAPDAFMAYELQPGYLSGGGVFSGLAPEYDRAEHDHSGFAAFHRWFMSEYYPGELILRPLYDNDIVLLERWLAAGHVQPWYEHPGDWLRELNNRRGEFSFITHLIAEIEGIPIGFCQYYDLFYGQAHEQWLNISTPGVMFSIDYLIGEPEHLHKGLGQKMMARMLDMLRDKDVKTVVVRPDGANAQSSRALEANGFVWNGTDYILEL
ncbi:MAG: Aminoglycoside N(6')-acetyltransferase type 1 [Firmicutes bacterium ADurb.Bin373]|nr:GNAT family N-acetyltransferase [Bacillota bacterium]OQA09538.1 MAG: Aminoglycoside N(6')-acetyltransferase type 1 [Firmicutes bacterium ADurb.Bin373]